MAQPFLTAIDLRKNELQNARIQNLATSPSSPVEGQLYYDTDDDILYWWNGTVWKSAEGGALADDSVTFAKIQNITSDRLIGRDTAATGDPEEISVGGGIEFTGAGAIRTTAFTGDVTKAAGGTALTIPNDTVTYAKMQDVSAASRILGRGSAAGAGDAQELSVGASLVINGTVVERAALTGDVTAAQNGNATTIANDAVTNAKLANMAANSFKGNNTGGAADPVDLTVAQAKTLLAIVHTDISDFDTGVRESRLDQMAAPTASVNLNSQKITGLADGTAATDAATFGQLSAAIQGFDWKEPVRAATTANIATLAGGAPNTVDGVSLAVGDRVLVKNQTTAAQDGIYEVQTLGTGANGTWVRTADMDVAAEANNATVLVEAGTLAAGDIYTQTATIVTLGTTSMAWVKSSEGNTVYTADGTTITLTGTQFAVTAGGIGATQLAASVAGNGLAGGAGTALSVTTDGTTIEVSGDAVRIAATAAGNGLTGGGGSALAVNAGTGLEISSDAVRIAAAAAGNGLTGGGGSALAVGAGTGIAVTADAVAVDRTGTNNAHVPLKHAATIGDGVATSIAVTHNLGSTDVIVQVFEIATGEQVWTDIVRTSANVATLSFATAPANASLRVVILG